MSPWFQMPSGPEARRAAAAAQLAHSLRAVRCAATLLVVGAQSERDRGLATAMLREIKAAERAAGAAFGARIDGPLM